MTKATGKIQRDAVLRWIPLDKIHVSPAAQRDLNPSRVDKILANLDLEQIGVLTVSERDGIYYCIDGQHRKAALAAFFEDDPSIKVQCWVYFELNEEQEAERFLTLNDTLAVSAYAKFKVGVTAGRPVESDIDRIVRAQGCVVSQDKIPGAVGAVSALRTIYSRTGASNLARTIRVAVDAFGDPGLDNMVLLGIAFALDRYRGAVDDGRLVAQLGKTSGGTKGLIQSGETYRLSTGNSKHLCVAAAVVDRYNAGLAPRAAKRLPSWWKDLSAATA